MTQVTVGQDQWTRGLRRRRCLEQCRFEGVAGPGGLCGLHRRRSGVRHEKELERRRASRASAALQGMGSQFTADASSDRVFGEFAHGVDKGVERRSGGFGDDRGRSRRARGLCVSECLAEEGRSWRRNCRRVDGGRIRRRRGRSSGFVGKSRRRDRALQKRTGSTGSRATGPHIAPLHVSGWLKRESRNFQRRISATGNRAAGHHIASWHVSCWWHREGRGEKEYLTLKFLRSCRVFVGWMSEDWWVVSLPICCTGDPRSLNCD